MSETIFLYSAIYATSLVLIGLLLTMRVFSRLSRPETLKVRKTEHAYRSRTNTSTAYVKRYSGA
jgi:hypothetical protein